MVIAPCSSVEQAGWLSLRRALWPEGSDAEHLAEMAELLAQPHRFAQFVAYDDSPQAIGFVEGSIRSDYVNGTESSPVAFLEGIYVLPTSRRFGVARTLLAAVSEWAADRGVHEFASDAALDNALSHAVHKALGFAETERVVYFRKALPVAALRKEAATHSLEFSASIPAADDFKSLYDTTGWGPTSREPAYYQGALGGSWFTQSAYSAGQLVGFARVISDGHLHAFITEMIVHPGFQGRGIGSTLLSAVLEACHRAGIADIQLFSARGKSTFYEQHGFVSRPGDGPGMQFCPKG